MPVETLTGAVTGTDGTDGNAAFTVPSGLTPVGELVINDGIVLVNGQGYTFMGPAFTFLAPYIPIAGRPNPVIYYGSALPVNTAPGTGFPLVSVDSAGSIINDAFVELGLGAAVADPYASSDPNFIKLCGYMKSLGRDRLGRRNWSHLQIEATIVTVAGQEVYALPANFRNMLQGAGWDRTARLPLGGPLDAGEWQYLKALQSGVLWTMYCRIQGNTLRVYGGTSVPGGRQITFEYASFFWAGKQSDTSVSKEFPTASTDKVFFEPQMMMKGLKDAYARNNGYGDIFKDESEDAYAKACNSDANMPALKLTPKSRDDLISVRNLPPSGYGQ